MDSAADDSPAIPRATPAVARRTRLREFQAQLVDRMHAAQSGVDAPVNQLGVLVGERRCLIKLPHAGEIVPVGSITSVPWTQDWYLGLTNIRGNLVGVVDLARFYGEAHTAIDRECRVVAFASVLNAHCGLLVSRILGLRNLDHMTPQAEELPPEGMSHARVFADRDAQMWYQLDLSEIVRDPRFLQIAS